ncbi:MAG: hypothetical protein U0575_12010 [Phycisphaerales bacterium]
MESISHATLKRLAAEFLLRIGCCTAASEVTCPIARYRVDAAGYADDEITLPRRGERALATLWSLEAALVVDSGPFRRASPRRAAIAEERRRGLGTGRRGGGSGTAAAAGRTPHDDRRMQAAREATSSATARASTGSSPSASGFSAAREIEETRIKR